MSAAPYIPLWIDDFDAAIAHLTLEEEAVYSRLMRLAWRTIDCVLANDINFIARKIRAEKPLVEAILNEFFTLDDKNRWFQKRLKAEFEGIIQKIEKRKNAGKLGGKAKSLKVNGFSSSNATILPEHCQDFASPMLCQPEPEPEPEPDDNIIDKSIKLSSATAPTVLDKNKIEINEFWKNFPPRGDPPTKENQTATASEYRKAREKHSHEFLMQNLEIAKSRWKECDPKFIPKPSNWLKKETWKDEQYQNSNSNYRQRGLPDYDESQPDTIGNRAEELEVLEARNASTITLAARRII